MAPILGLQNSSEEKPFGCPTAAGKRAPGSCYGVSSVSTEDAKWLGYCRSGVCIAQAVDGVWEKGSGDTALFNV
jgi:hypothetical protein